MKARAAHRSPAARPIGIGLLAVLLVSQGAAEAQQLAVAVSNGPHYVGTLIEIQVTATDFPGSPEPELTVPVPASGRLDFIDVRPSSSQSITIVNGRLTRREEARAVYRYRFVADAPGQVTVGPFSLSQGGAQGSSRIVQLLFRRLAPSDRLAVRLELPKGPVFVGQRVPIAVEFWMESSLKDNLHDYTLQVPLFDQTENFRFSDSPGAGGSTEVEIETARGKLRLSGSAREELRGDKKFIVVRVPRTLIPSRAGTVKIPRSSLVAEEATRWRRDFFGGRRATHVRKFSALGQPHSIEVAAVPAANRPESFAGAVGRGYSLEVSADRSVVQVGDPITLTLTLRGEGNLESAGFPSLSAKGLLDATEFRIPVGELAGKLEGDAKHFTAVVRVESPDVREISALDYSWFDADTQTFQTTHSRPIALSVRTAQLVGADDVVSGEVAQESEAIPKAPTSGARPDSVTALTGADLAIERDMATLETGPSSTAASDFLLAFCYLAPSLLLGLSLLDRRRRAVDPALAALRKSLESQRRRILAASTLSAREQAREFAAGLREMLAEVPDARNSTLEQFLGECDALVYAPEGATTQPDEPLSERARSHAQRILEQAC